MKKVEVSLCIITLNSAKSIGRCIASMKDYVEEICLLDNGSTDGTVNAAIAAAGNTPIKVQTFEDPNRHPEKGWTSDFGDLRNRNSAMATKDVILWLDSDDVAVRGRNLRAAINDAFGGKYGEPCDAMSVLYVYAKDESGNWTSALPRHRAYLRGAFDWEGCVHEDTRPLRPTKVMPTLDHEIAYIDHESKNPKSPESAGRNLWILEQYQRRGGKMNDRLWQNVATSMNLLGRYSEACEAFQKSIDAPHNNTECDYITFLRWGEACLRLARPEEACEKFAKAQLLFPNRKAPYLALAEVCIHRQQAEQALIYCTVADNMHGDENGFAWQPSNDKIAPTAIRAEAYMLVGEYERASKCYEELAKMLPTEERVVKPRDLLREMFANQKLYESFMLVHRSLEAFPASQEALVGMAPRMLHSYPEIAKLRIPPRPEGKRTVAIYCGNSQNPWGWDSLETGIGGSEEAVILLSRELVREGWHVEVYAFPGREQIGTDPYGVVWTPYYAFDPERPVDVFVGWRQYMQPCPSTAALRVLWLHDTVVKEYFTEDMVAGWDVIFTVSAQHAEGLPDHALPKLVVSANGLSSDFFADGPNHPHEFIYASSPDRGLLPLLREWPKIKAALPDATLDVFYGFTQNFMAEASRNTELRKLKDDIVRLLEQPGVFMHGMVGQRELAHAFARCGFWLYPTAWAETSCITAQKAQAMGCIPITSRHKDSALAETCGTFDIGPAARDGSIYDQPEWLAEWTETVIRESARDHAEHRQTMKAWARKEFSWQRVATQWSALFSERLPAKVPRPSMLPETTAAIS
jgi:glycosyltransferase involved in cell wall biosynthesis